MPFSSAGGVVVLFGDVQVPQVNLSASRSAVVAFAILARVARSSMTPALLFSGLQFGLRLPADTRVDGLLALVEVAQAPAHWWRFLEAGDRHIFKWPAENYSSIRHDPRPRRLQSPWAGRAGWTSKDPGRHHAARPTPADGCSAACRADASPRAAAPAGPLPRPVFRRRMDDPAPPRGRFPGLTGSYARAWEIAPSQIGSFDVSGNPESSTVPAIGEPGTWRSS